MASDDILQRLGQRVDESAARRQAQQDAEYEFKEWMGVIDSSPQHSEMGFWCDSCKRDFSCIGTKQVRETDGSWPIAWYVGFCPKNHQAIRRITHKKNDPYNWKSEVMRRFISDTADDYLQPDDPRFRQVYPEQWKKLQRELEAREEHEYIRSTAGIAGGGR